MTQASQHQAAPRWEDRDLYLALLIRQVESYLLQAFARGLVAGTVHTCLGQELVAVALAPLLAERDMFFGTHRSHGHYLAQHDDPGGLLAELLGRVGGVCNGVGGSQHLFREGRFLSTGVQGHGVAAAAGAALARKHAGTGGIAVASIGDGTWGQGIVYETLNMAALWQLPLLVLVENNQIAQSTPLARHLAGSIAGRAAAFGIDYLHLGSSDLVGLRQPLAQAIDALRSSPRPLVVEVVTTRLGPHSKGDDTRPSHETDALWERDGLARYRAAYPEQWGRVDAEVRLRLEAVIADVEARPLAAAAAEPGT